MLSLNKSKIFLVLAFSVVLLGSGLSRAHQHDHGKTDKNETEILKLFGHVKTKLQALEKAAATPKLTDALKKNDDYCQARLILHKFRLIATDPMSTSEGKLNDIRKLMEPFDKLIEAVQTNKPIVRPFVGLHEWVYMAPQDNAPEPYYAYVPKSAKGKKKLPLVVFLHGYVPEMNKLNWYEMSSPNDLFDLADKQGFIAAMAFGRSLTEFMGIGEWDVLHVIKQLKDRYDIDPDRVFLAGISMGGSGAWTIGAHYPHLFAGIIPIAGRTDYYLWKELDAEKMAPFKRRLTDVNYVSALTENFRNLGLYCNHAVDDRTVSPEHNRAMIKRMKKMGFTHPICDEMPFGGHYMIWGYLFKQKAFAKWLNTTRRNPWPRRISYRTFLPKYHKAYWAEITRYEKFQHPASFDVEITDKKLIVKSENVGQLKLTLDPVKLKIKGKLTVVCRPLEGPAEIELADKPIELLLTKPVNPVVQANRKTPAGLSGPIPEAYNEPFLFVYGQGADPRKLNPSSRLAYMNATHWVRYARGVPEMKADNKVTETDIKTKHLILFGTPKTNTLIAKIADKLPVKIGEESFVVGKKTYKGKDLGAIVIAPNPLNLKKYVVVHSGRFWGLGLETNHRFDFLPDFIIFQDKLDDDGCNHYLSAGFFNNLWQLDSNLTWEQPRLKLPAPEPEK